MVEDLSWLNSSETFRTKGIAITAPPLPAINHIPGQPRIFHNVHTLMAKQKTTDHINLLYGGSSSPQHERLVLREGYVVPNGKVL